MPHVLRRPQLVRSAAAALGLIALAGLTGCGAGRPRPAAAATASPAGSTAGSVAPTGQAPAASVPALAAVAGSGRTAPVTPLAHRLSPAVLVTTATSLPADTLRSLLALSPDGGALALRAGKVQVGGKSASAIGADPSALRTFTAKGTAEADGVWQSVARGELVASHALAKDRSLTLGAPVPAGASGRPLRLGALATTGLPGSDVVVDDSEAAALGLAPATGVVLTARPGVDPVTLAGQVRALAGAKAKVDLLSAPTASPVAFLTGSRAAKAFGAFSYRYFADGTIQPDASWVRHNIVSATLPIVGRVTCHRLMVTQLRGALTEIAAAGLGNTLHHYDGCYVPRFIESNPDRSISLHTWGIAIDLDAAQNGRGTAGHMDPHVVAIFKRWGFAWGGDWHYTDPMHFELGAILTSPKS